MPDAQGQVKTGPLFSQSKRPRFYLFPFGEDGQIKGVHFRIAIDRRFNEI